MIINPYAAQGSFGYVTSNVLTSRPNTSYGTTVAVGTTANTMGSWVELIAGSSIQYNCYKLVIKLHNASSSGIARNILADIGIDPTGGTSYSVLINNLCASMVTSANVLSGGSVYTFPIFIPAGSSLACRAQGSSGGTYNINGVQVILYGQPSNLEGLVYGHAVETLGANSATSIGTTIAVGTTSKSAWTSIGTTTYRWKSIQTSYGQNTGAVNSNFLRLESGFGDGTNMTILQPDVFVSCDSTERISVINSPTECDIPAGSTIYVRAQTDNVNPTNPYSMVYGVY